MTIAFSRPLIRAVFGKKLGEWGQKTGDVYLVQQMLSNPFDGRGAVLPD